MKAIEINNLSKTYHDVKALKNINFDVEKGEIFGLIGPDGAGKTSLIRILSTLILPDQGEAFVMGLNVVKEYKALRNILGYMPQRFSLYTDLTVEENLKFYAEIFGTSIKDNYYLIEPIYKQIEPFKKRKAGHLSGGMKQKLALSCALIHKPKVLFLDEPTTGVDAVSRIEFWEMLKNYQKEGITILVSTPYMDEAWQCNRLAFIKDGILLNIATPDEIIKNYPFNIYEIASKEVIEIIKYLNHSLPDAIVNRFGTTLHCSTNLSLSELNRILEVFNDVKIKKITPTIEDCFLWISQAKIS